MAKYLVSGTYTPEGLQGLQADKASGRRRILKKVISGLEGKLESLYFSFGGDDVYIIALSVAASASGLVSVTTTPLLTVDEMDEALAMSTGYVPPGGNS